MNELAIRLGTKSPESSSAQRVRQYERKGAGASEKKAPRFEVLLFRQIARF
jgi:hypothetical protein